MSQPPTRQSVDHLIKQKKDIEILIDAYHSTLSANNATLHSPSLVDASGFPRSDIDILAIRTARQGLIRAKNDLRDVMDELAKGLEVLMPVQSVKESGVVGKEDLASGKRIPFARVNSVMSNSPAELSGLKPQDQIIQFSHLTSETISSLTDIAKVVNRSEEIEVKISILRSRLPVPSSIVNPDTHGKGEAVESHQDPNQKQSAEQTLSEGEMEEIDIILVPRNGWGGRGMLGCHILPV